MSDASNPPPSLRRPALRRTWILAALVVALAGVAAWEIGIPKLNSRQRTALVGRKAYDEQADGPTLVSEALRRAASERKRVLAVMGGNSCIWCLALDKRMQEDEDIRAFVDQNFVMVKLNDASNAALDEKWGRPTKNGVPVLVFLEPPDGNVVAVVPSWQIQALGGRLLDYSSRKVMGTLKRWVRASS